MWQKDIAKAAIELGKELIPSVEQKALNFLGIVSERTKSSTSGLDLQGAALAGRTESALSKPILDAAERSAANSLPSLKFVDVHVSESANLAQELRNVDPGNSFKPQGLWTSNKMAWVPRGPSVSPLDAVGGHAYHVDTSQAKFLEIGTTSDLEKFLQRYGTPSSFPSRLDGKISMPDIHLDNMHTASPPEVMALRHSEVNWQEVAKKYDGVRFSNQQQISRGGFRPDWYRSLDLDSTVTWNNVDKVKVTPLGKVPSPFKPNFEQSLDAIVKRATQLQAK